MVECNPIRPLDTSPIQIRTIVRIFFENVRFTLYQLDTRRLFEPPLKRSPLSGFLSRAVNGEETVFGRHHTK